MERVPVEETGGKIRKNLRYRLFGGPKIEDLGNWKRSDRITRGGEPSTPLHPFQLSGTGRRKSFYEVVGGEDPHY